MVAAGARSPWSRCSPLLGYTRLGMRIRAGTLDLETVSVLGVNVRVCATSISASASILAGLAGRARGRHAGPAADDRQRLIMPSFVAIIIGGLGSLPGTLLGGLLIGVASGLTTVFFPSASEAVIYVMMGAGAAGAAARPVGRGGPASDDTLERANSTIGRRRR